MTGTDLSGDGGTAGNGGGGGGLLGGGGGAGGDTAKSGTSSSSNGTAPAPAPAPSTNKGGVCGSGESTGVAACDTCLDQKCCAAFQACDENAECKAEWKCAETCNGDRTCGQECRTEHPAGDADLQAFVACVQSCGACQ